MTEPTIICPKCKTEIKLTKSLAAPLIESICKQFEQQLARKDSDIAARGQAMREKEKQLTDAKNKLDEQVNLTAGRGAAICEFFMLTHGFADHFKTVNYFEPTAINEIDSDSFCWFARNVGAQIDTNLKRAEHLRKYILSSAFAGQLTSVPHIGRTTIAILQEAGS